MEFSLFFWLGYLAMLLLSVLVSGQEVEDDDRAADETGGQPANERQT
jgi:hypothetical protein